MIEIYVIGVVAICCIVIGMAISEGDQFDSAYEFMGFVVLVSVWPLVIAFFMLTWVIGLIKEFWEKV